MGEDVVHIRPGAPFRPAAFAITPRLSPEFAGESFLLRDSANKISALNVPNALTDGGIIGQETLPAKAERRAKLAQPREIESTMHALGALQGPRWRGRKPATEKS